MNLMYKFSQVENHIRNCKKKQLMKLEIVLSELQYGDQIILCYVVSHRINLLVERRLNNLGTKLKKFHY